MWPILKFKNITTYKTIYKPYELTYEQYIILYNLSNKTDSMVCQLNNILIYMCYYMKPYINYVNWCV